ncbi:hypothetical protein IQ215_08225 [Cyanobacterium stanieri LEGE 03274]|uniref:Uncharacterized protein n=1 Tax=Cyanobacterium stanieri LEGE 03274 TaxID=1828756 RepID=A0ABR9V475_9CHRO|nr:hypothetical protein [Cyanobacterium stanieri LEGE 03274]
MNIPKLSKNKQFNNGGSEQYLFDHLLYCVKTETPEQVIERFHRLFIQAQGYDDQKVWECLANIIGNPQSSEQFPLILNRCCHILVNRWQLSPQTQGYIVDLINCFKYVPKSLHRGYVRTFSEQLRSCVRGFIDSDYYKQLKRLANVIGEGKMKKEEKKEEILGNLINRYPYLYDHCLLGVGSSIEQQQTVHKVKHELEKKFETHLSRFVTYQLRVAQKRDNGEAIDSRIITPVENPTLLSKRDLGRSLKQYVGAAENGYSYQEVSRSFLAHTQGVRNYQIFKDNLYEYITQSIDGKYGKNSFNKRLYEQFQGLYPEYNNKRPDEFLKTRTYSQIFNYLIVESPQNPNHLVFMDMISNMGTTKTVGLFLKLVLTCNRLKPYLEKRFSILFNHYESFTKDGAMWLVRSLEKVNVAFSVNFSNVDMSFLKRLYLPGR